MNAQLIPKAPRRKKQPSSARLREQLALAADAQIAARAEAVAARRRLVAVYRALSASLVLVLIAAASRWAGWLPIGGIPQ